MTKQDALTRWCPNFRVITHQGQVLANRDKDLTATCIADACACWVWDTKNGIKIGDKNYVPEGTDINELEGCCGLVRR